MARLVIAIVLLAVLSWTMLYAVKGKIKSETHSAIKGGVISLSIALGIILAIFALFSLKGLING